MGRGPVGILIYTEQGYMSATIARSQRTRFVSESLFEGRDTEKISAFDEYVSYCGRYEIKGNRIFHKVETSLFPNWIRTTISSPCLDEVLKNRFVFQIAIAGKSVAPLPGAIFFA